MKICAIGPCVVSYPSSIYKQTFFEEVYILV